MFKAAAEGYIVYAHFWVGLEQMASTLHLDIQNERDWRTARERNYLAMELPWTHAHLFCKRIHVKLLFVHKQIGMRSTVLARKRRSVSVSCTSSCCSFV